MKRNLFGTLALAAGMVASIAAASPAQVQYTPSNGNGQPINVSPATPLPVSPVAGSTETVNQGAAGASPWPVQGAQSNAAGGTTGSTNVPTNSYTYVWNGSAWVQVSSSNPVPVSGTVTTNQGAAATSGPWIVAQPDVPTAPAAINSATANAAVTVVLGNAYGVTDFAVSGLTAAGATLTIEGQVCSTTTPCAWTALTENGATGGAAPISTMTADAGLLRVDSRGLYAVRLRVSSTGTGTITIAANASAVSAGRAAASSNHIGSVGIDGALPAGTNLLGNFNAYQGGAANALTNPFYFAPATGTSWAVTLPTGSLAPSAGAAVTLDTTSEANLAAPPAKFTSTAAQVTITAGGTAQPLFSGVQPTNGYQVCNPAAAGGDTIWLSETTTAAANAGIGVPPGWCYRSPVDAKPGGVVSALGATTADKLTVWNW